MPFGSSLTHQQPQRESTQTAKPAAAAAVALATADDVGEHVRKRMGWDLSYPFPAVSGARSLPPSLPASLRASL